MKPLEYIMVEGNPKKPRVWLRVSERKLKMMIYDDAGREKMLWLNNGYLIVYEKKFPRESRDTTASDPCIPMDSKSFVWTSTKTIFIFCRYKMKIEEYWGWRMNKTKDHII